MTTITLPSNFDGKGEVKGFVFTKVKETEFGYMYRVNSDSRCHYEVFRKTSNPVCIDFDQRIYSETERKETYPTARQFGSTAWTFKDMEAAEERLNEIKPAVKL